ncbi:MAG: pantothenate kinase [spirochete symbiont of Stewartia floridana]|nr:MAG: pantothenate kinase [spirochete symbiont of Stewartia floridana]
MILALDVGNSHIFGGIVQDGSILLQFRKSSKLGVTSDELGVFLRGVLNENNVSSGGIEHISICSVVPALIHTLTNTCLKYFQLPPFILTSDSKTGISFMYRNPQELGADRIANAIAAVNHFPYQNIIIVDFGTATTICAVSRERTYLGGIILPGLGISMKALASETAKLPTVEIKPPGNLIGLSTVESIQSGLYYGNLAIIQKVCAAIKSDYFTREETVIIGTGGFVRLFEKENLFDAVIPDLVLTGLSIAVGMNQQDSHLPYQSIHPL